MNFLKMCFIFISVSKSMKIIGRIDMMHQCGGFIVGPHTDERGGFKHRLKGGTI